MRVNSPKIIIFLLAILLLFYCLVYAQVRQPLKQRLNIVSRKLEFARELQATFHEQSPIEQLKSAELKLGRARELMQARWRLFVQVNQLINETEILVNQVMRNLLREPIRVLRESLDIKILKAKDIIRNSGNNEANNLLVEGIENKAIAEQEFKTDEFQKAIKHFRQAQFRVQKSIDIVMNRDKTTATKADNEAQQFDQLFAQLKAIITKSTDPEVQKKL